MTIKHHIYHYNVHGIWGDCLSSPVRTGLSLLLPAGFVTDGRSEVDTITIGQSTSCWTEQDTKAALLEYVDIVIIGVAHRPAWRMSPGIVNYDGIHKTTVTIGPFTEFIEFRVWYSWYNCIIDVPVGGNSALDFQWWWVRSTEMLMS